MAKEIVILSGKGGTGKTSLSASFAILADNPVIADCDVDAANLHLLLDAKTEEDYPFVSGHVAVIDAALCTGCARCVRYCSYDAIDRDGRIYRVDPIRCEGCALCLKVCPSAAIDFPESECGRWMVSSTKAGPMVHAHLHPGAENSGKLVTLVRKEASNLSDTLGKDIIISDGPPGIGCPVIASMTNTDMVVLVTEPSLSAIHDVERVIRLARSFGIPLVGCINKADIDLELSNDIKNLFSEAGVSYAGSVDYDEQIVKAQVLGLSPIELVGKKTIKQIEHIWESIWNMM